MNLVRPTGRLVVVLWVATAALFSYGVLGAVVVDNRVDSRTAVTYEVELPEGPAASQLRWVLARLGKGAPASEIREHLAPSALDAITPDELNSVLIERGEDGPFAVRAAEAEGPHDVSVFVAGARQNMTVDLVVEGNAPHRIVALRFHPIQKREPYASFDELVVALSRAAPEVGFLAAQVVDGECRAVTSLYQERPLAVASAFKLYVLGALAEGIARGDLRWEQVVPVRDDQRVHTSAHFGAQTGRREGTVQELGRAMIEVSDNTATDVLIGLVGRAAVEAALGSMGMRDPSANIPFLSTREMSHLKWGRPPAAADYLAQQGAGARRQFLDERLTKGPAREEDILFIKEPSQVDTVGWFAFASDLCHAHVALADMATRPGLEPLREILGANTGLRFEPPPAHVAFKGGSEPGVLSGAWLIETADGRRHAVVLLLRNSAGDIGTDTLRAAADAYRLLLEDERTSVWR